MVDHDLLQAAINAYLKIDRAGGVIDEAMTAAIEAYEAARPEPNPWRPLSEIDCAKPGRVLVWMPVDDLNDRLFVDRVWPSEGDSRDWQDYAARPENSGAMFRTIDLPTQDAVSRATSTPPAAEASS